MKTVKIEVTVTNDLVGCDQVLTDEIDKSEWDDMSEQEQDQYCRMMMYEVIDFSFKVIE